MRLFILLGSLCVAQAGLSFAVTKTNEPEQPKKSQLSAVLSLYQSSGAGTFLPKDRRKADISTNFTIKPTYLTMPLYSDRQLKLSFEQDFGVAWIDPKVKAAQKTTFELADLKLKASIKNAVQFQDAGFGFTPEARIEVPWGRSSRAASRVIAFGASLTSKWSKHGFSLSYKPVATAYAHSSNYKTASCGEGQQLVDVPEPSVDAKSVGPGESTSELPTSSEITNYKLPNGKCIAASRQSLAMLENGGYIGYERGAHSLTIGMRLNHSFLRSMKDTPLLNEYKVPKGAYTVASTGLVEYVYTLPTTKSFTIAAGVKSTQPLSDENGSINLPFFDYKNAASNNTQLYIGLDLTV